MKLTNEEIKTYYTNKDAGSYYYWDGLKVVIINEFEYENEQWALIQPAWSNNFSMATEVRKSILTKVNKAG